MGSRIVFDGSPDTTADLEQVSSALEISKVASIRLAISMLSTIISEIKNGGKVVLRDTNGKERELWLPTIKKRKQS